MQSSSYTKDSNTQSGRIGSQSSGTKNQLGGSGVVVVSQPIPHNTTTGRMADDLRMPVLMEMGLGTLSNICLFTRHKL